MRDITLGETVYFNFTTRAFATGIPTVLAGSQALSVLEETNATPITAGVSVEVDRASVVGLNQATIVATGGNGYEAGKGYCVYISTGTVATVSVVGEVVAQFTIAASAAATDLANGTDGLTAIKAETALILADTAEIGTAGVGLSNIGTIATCTTVTNAVTLPTIPTDWLTADGIATDAIGAAEFAQAAADKIWSSSTRDLTAIGVTLGVADFDAAALRQLGGLLFSGTADAGGTTTTIDDAALTEADDIWTGNWVLITSGTSANQMRLITDFDAATDVLTFAPALSSSIGAGVTFEIYANAGVDVQSWLGTLAALAAPNALVGGAVDADVSALQAGAITAAAIATDAIDADAVAADAIDLIWDETLAGHVTADTAGLVLNDWQDGGRLDLLLNALQVDLDTLTDASGEPGQGAPGVSLSMKDKVSWLYKVLRNRKTATATLINIYNDNTTTVDHKKVTSDDGTTYDEGEMITGA